MGTETKLARLQERFGLHFEWLLQILIHPRKTIATISEQEKPVWLTPMATFSFLAIVSALIAWPIKRDAIINGLTLPADFQYYSTDQQAQFLTAQATQSSVLFTFIFPVLGALVTLWLVWFLMSSILHMGHFISGSSTDKQGYFNLTAWVMTPIAVRQFVQILAMLISHKTIASAGLSGFIASAGTGAGFLAGILAQVDIYFIWEVILLMIGVVPLSGLTKTKSWTVTAITLLIIVLLMAIPHFVGSVISGVSGGLSSGMY